MDIDERNTMAAKTHGEVFATSPAYRNKIARGQHATDPIRAEVARLQSEGMGGEQAWAQVLKFAKPITVKNRNLSDAW